MKGTMRTYFALTLTFALLFLSLPNMIFANQPPSISMVAVDGQTGAEVNVEEGEVSYTLVIQSYSSNGKALVNIDLKNLDTNEVTNIYKDQWLVSGVGNNGTMQLKEGRYEFIVNAKDEDNRAADPYIMIINVGAVGSTNYRIDAEGIQPNPILVDKDGQVVNVIVPFINESGVNANVAVAWRWADETKWNGTQNLNLPNKFVNGGQGYVNFAVTVALKGNRARDIVFAINPGQTLPESNYADNEATISIGYKEPNLAVTSILVDKWEDDHITVDIAVTQEAKTGITDPITTTVDYGVLGIPAGSTTVTLAPGQVQWIRGVVIPIPQAEEITIYAEINKNLNPPEWADDNKFWLTLYPKKQINVRTLSVSGGVYRQGEDITTVVVVDNVPQSVMPKETDVVLKLDGKEIGRQKVFIKPGESRTLYFDWKAPKKGTSVIKGVLEATINPEPRDFTEITYVDNTQRANITLLPIVNGAPGCEKPNNRDAVSGYYEYYDCSNGVCVIRVAPYYEGINVNMTPPTPKRIKAGMGFSFEVTTEYHNDNPNNGINHGFKEVTADFPDGSTPMVPEFPDDKRNNHWFLPRAKIERGQEDLKAIEYEFQIEPFGFDPLDPEQVDGGNKHYTSFYAKDTDSGEIYGYTAWGENAGVNTITYTNIKGETNIIQRVSPRLSFCIADTVDIKGSPHDDYVFRRVDPNNPFPQSGKHGWDWDGKTGVFSSIRPWWNSFGGDESSLPIENWTIEIEN